MRRIDLSSLPQVGEDFGQFEARPDALVIHAGPGTDAFVPPDGSPGTDRLPGVRLPVSASPWAVSTYVEPTFRAAFDAGVDPQALESPEALRDRSGLPARLREARDRPGDDGAVRRLSGACCW